jgi:hypothetical protein
MRRAAVLAVVVCAAVASAQVGTFTYGQLRNYDADKGTVTVRVAGKDRVLVLTKETRILGADGATPAEQMEDFDLGSQVVLKAERREGKDVLLLFRPPPMPAAMGGGEPASKVDASGFKPLTELGKIEYRGSAGGLYPGGNERPKAHEALGEKLATEVRPRDGAGKPAEGGKIGLLSVGMNNAGREFAAFARLAKQGKGLNPALVFVNGAQVGMSADRMCSPESFGGQQFWAVVDERLGDAGLTRAQVQVAWLKQADGSPGADFPAHARNLQRELRQVVTFLHRRFPNLKLVYLSSRTYGGYATSPLNPEPYAYESGFAVKWLVADQIKGDPALNCDPGKGAVHAPWLGWGPYLWAAGDNKRGDGLPWVRADFGRDGTLPSASGRRKVAEQLVKFFSQDETSRKWFLKG